MGCAHTYFTFVSQLKVFLSSVKVYSASEGSGILPFVRPDDFGCELMEGDAEGGKWQMSGNEKKKAEVCFWILFLHNKCSQNEITGCGSEPREEREERVCRRYVRLQRKFLWH